jgi:hypothetical protein
LVNEDRNPSQRRQRRKKSHSTEEQRRYDTCVDFCNRYYALNLLRFACKY